MFAGFRDAAGRNPLLGKKRYYSRAMRLGMALGVVAVGLIALVVGLCLGLSSAPDALYHDFEVAGLHMLMVYTPYAFIAMVALGFFFIPRPEISSLTTVIVLGPFTMLRPLVIIAGAVFGAVAVPRAEVFLFVGTAALVMGSFERVLGKLDVNPRDLDRQVALERSSR